MIVIAFRTNNKNTSNVNNNERNMSVNCGATPNFQDSQRTEGGTLPTDTVSAMCFDQIAGGMSRKLHGDGGNIPPMNDRYPPLPP